ncbi:hypothetical protein AVEN_47083-1 [Araneus ventricosus]|uniref:Uncharacterized protein n=1 Tax=Araneus ventricosus TaxID=182803 RepID=A0A4Y2LGE5_ARAVE|nr:hypothetical protein AVEN_47083-1 [Araneus ventricosus]
MSDLSLYKSCLRKVAIFLRDGIYKSCHENPFSFMPSNIVNDLMSTALVEHGLNGWRVGDLEQLLTSGRLRELRINGQDVNTDRSQIISEVLYFLKSGCQELEVLHLSGLIHYQVENTKPPKPEVSEALGSLLRNAPNLKDIHCCFGFDLKALRNCKKLRSVRLHYCPQQPLYNFLAKENGNFEPHKYLEFLTVCRIRVLIPSDEIVVILRHCPELTSLGYIESSRALSQIHRMSVSPSEFKLRQCYWSDVNSNTCHNWSERESRGIIRDASLHRYPKMEELVFMASSIKSIAYLRKLRNLVFLEITSLCDENIGAVFRYVLQEIGSRLKHLSVDVFSLVDISIFLQYCPNLESLKIGGHCCALSASSVIHLPRLQRLTIVNIKDRYVRRIFSQLSGCNQLTDLFLLDAGGFDDKSLHQFLKRNSLSNLKIAYLQCCGLTKDGFREFLLNAPQLEIVEMYDHDIRSIRFERVIRETNHKAICNEGLFSYSDEFFEKRRAFCGHN